VIEPLAAEAGSPGGSARLSEVKYDHLKADAQDAKRSAEREAREEDRL
jgi:hypothetical protein